MEKNDVMQVGTDQYTPYPSLTIVFNSNTECYELTLNNASVPIMFHDMILEPGVTISVEQTRFDEITEKYSLLGKKNQAN